MSLEDDLAIVRSAVDGDDRLDDDLRTAIVRLAQSTDERALHLLVEAFTWSVYTSWTELKDALAESVHPDASVYIAGHLRTWWDDDDTLCISHAGPVLASRGDDRVLPTLREMSEIAKDDSIVLRALLVARIALGDADARQPARDEFLSGRSHQGTDAYPELVMKAASPGAFYDTFAEIVRRYQAGERELREAAAKVVFQVTNRPYRYEGRKRVYLPWPDRDSRWMELGIEIHEQRPRPRIRPYAAKLLRVPHPNRTALLQSIGRHPKPNPLLQSLPDPLATRHRDGGWSMFDRAGVTWLDTRTLTVNDLDAIFDAWGDRAATVHGISFAGRRLDAAAFTKLFDWPGLERFTHFDFAHTPLTARDIRKLFRSERLRHALYLNLRGIAARKPPLHELGAAEPLRSLRALVLGSGNDHGPQFGLSTLMSLAEGEPVLDRLELHDFRFDRGMSTFGSTELARSLSELRVAGWYRMGSDAGELLHRIASGGGRLRRLELPHCFRNLGPGDWNAAGECTLDTFDALDLSGGATSDLFPNLASAWFLPALGELVLARTYVYQDRLAPLLEVAMPKLRRLSLRDVEGLDRDLLVRLAHAPLAANLDWLDVGGATDLCTDDETLVPSNIRDAMRAAGWPHS